MEVHACSSVGVGRCCLFAGDRTVVGAGWMGRVVVQHQHRHHRQLKPGCFQQCGQCTDFWIVQTMTTSPAPTVIEQRKAKTTNKHQQRQKQSQQLKTTTKSMNNHQPSTINHQPSTINHHSIQHLRNATTEEFYETQHSHTMLAVSIKTTCRANRCHHLAGRLNWVPCHLSSVLNQ